jgi:hypothetical protein
MKKTLYPYLACLIFLSSCKQFAYYQSPLHTSTNSYKTIPLQSDSIKATTYASAVFFGGGANKNQRDGIAAFIGSLYRAHNFHRVQLHYGVTGMLGNYRISRYADESQFLPLQNNSNLNDSLINLHAGNNFFGSVGLVGGIDFVTPFDNGGEWRIIGVEACWQQEYGSYLSFRKGLPDTAANIINRYSQYTTIALGTEVLFKTKRGATGIKIARVYSTRTLHGYNSSRGKMEVYPGCLTIGTLLGVNCRIGK